MQKAFNLFSEILDEYRSILVTATVFVVIAVLSVQGLTLTKQTLENSIASGEQRTYTWANSEN